MYTHAYGHLLSNTNMSEHYTCICECLRLLSVQLLCTMLSLRAAESAPLAEFLDEVGHFLIS